MKLFFTNLKIKKKFILAFVISALIPPNYFGDYSFLNLRAIALENAIKDTRKNVEDVKIKLMDIVQNAVDISNKLYLDKKLLNILSTEYEDISKIYDDYISYTELSNLMSIYNKNIHAIKIYAFNPTLLDTGEIVKVDDYTKNQEWFKEAIKGDGKILWELVFDNNPFRPQYYFSLIRLIKNSYGERIGVMVIYIKKEKLEEVLSLHLNTLVITDKGIIVAAKDKDLVGKKLNFNFSSQDGKLIENVNIDGQRTMAILGTISASESGSSFLKVISFFSKKEIFKRVNKITFITFVLILVNSLVSLLLMLLFSKLITDRIAILNKKVNEISHGNLDAQINILGNDEIGQLTENIKTMAKNIKNLIDQVYLAEVQKQQIIAKQREIQFEMLCSQINPHFLFNTLEAIRMKAFCTGQYEIAQVVYLLSNLLRKSIEMTIDLITLEKEIEIVKEFLEIQKFRFGNKIDYKIEVQDDLLSSKVLPFIIQPLVENSIRHGIEPMIGKGTIEIKVFEKDGTIKIIVTDNGAGMPKEKLEEVLQSLDSKDKSHVGLKNVYHRLKLFYGEEAKIFINSELGKGTSVEIQIQRGEEVLLKAILIDDEPIILEGLQKIIDWKALGFEIVATAQDGIEGLEKIKKFKPEVALVDIRIPGIDGLTLINKLKEEGVNTKIIILSGYSEFEYAKEAIELGVESYLLKPVDPYLLQQKLEKVKQKISQEVEMQKIMRTTQEIGLEKVIEKLLLGTFDDHEIDYVSSFYGLSLPWKKYQVAIVTFCGRDNQKVIENKVFQLKREVDLFLKRNCCGYSTIINHDICILFKDFWYPFNSKSINMLKENLVRVVGNQVVISIGSEVDNYALIKESLNEAIELLEKRFLLGYKGIIYIGEYQESKESKKVKFDDKEYAEKLAMAIALNGFDSINQIIEEKSEQLLYSDMSEEDIKINFSNFYIETLYKLSQNELYKPLVEKYLSQEVLKSFYIQPTLTELKGLIKFYFVSLADEINKVNPDSLKQKIADFIEKNYFADIKLDTIANAFGYNSSYFSKLFKKIFGENFTVYLDRIRVEKAKVFLKEGCKVSETCKKVGFEDVDYFCSKFKKYVGLSPKEYKEKQKN